MSRAEEKLKQAVVAVKERLAQKDAEIAMWKKGFHGLELEIAELVKMLERVERNAVMPDTTWQLLDELINKYKNGE